MMIYDFYSDIDKEVLINFATNSTIGVSGISEIKKLFLEAKEHVVYEKSVKIQRAAETQVLGSGNNFSKNLLLYSLLKICGYNCKLQYNFIKDNTGKICNKGLKVYPWFFVTIDFFGSEIKLDCSFNREYMKAIGITYIGDMLDFKIDNYIAKGEAIFTKQSECQDVKDDKVIELVKTAGEYGIFTRNRGISYV